jgi:hypothetical protein
LQEKRFDSSATYQQPTPSERYGAFHDEKKIVSRTFLGDKILWLLESVNDSKKNREKKEKNL